MSPATITALPTAAKAAEKPKNSPSRRTRDELRADEQAAREEALRAQAAAETAEAEVERLRAELETLQAVREAEAQARAEALALAPLEVPTAAYAPPVPSSRYRRWMTLAVGVAIPAGYLGVAQVGATAYQSGIGWLAGLAAVFALGLVTVSLPHGAAALRDITGTSARAAWALAAVIDGLLVVAEAARVTVAPELGLGVVCGTLIVGVSLFSAVFNVHAFRSQRA